MSSRIFSKALRDAVGFDKKLAKDKKNLMKDTKEGSVMLTSEDALKSVRDASCLDKAPRKKKIDYFKMKEDEDQFSLTVEEIEELLNLESPSVSAFWNPEDMVLQDIYTHRISDNTILCDSLANDNCYADYISENHSSKAINTFSIYCCEKQMQYKIHGLEEHNYLPIPSPDIANFVPYGQNDNHMEFRHHSLPSLVENDLLSEVSSSEDTKQSIISKPSSFIDDDYHHLSSKVSPSAGIKRSISIISKPLSSIQDDLSSEDSSSAGIKRSITIINKSSSLIDDDLSSEGFSSASIKRSISVISKEYLNRKSGCSNPSTKLDTDVGFTYKRCKEKAICLKDKSFDIRTSKYEGCQRTDEISFNSNEESFKQIKILLPSYRFLDLMCFKSDSGFIDAHCHLDFLFQKLNFKGTFSEYQKHLKTTFPECYQGCIAVFCNPFTFAKKSIWQKYIIEENVWGSFGCHPNESGNYNDAIEETLLEALNHSKVRALGEIGLDYSNKNKCLTHVQHKVFRRQLKIARKKGLPLVIHCREANEDCMEIMQDILPYSYSIHLHCFTDSWTWAKKWLEAFPNLCIGITNIVTFPSAEPVHEVARNIPLDRLLLETDAPYFVPKVISRGRRFSHPGMAIHVAAQIAALKNISVGEVLQATSLNTKRIYRL